jgi:cell division protein FtsZ
MLDNSYKFDLPKHHKSIIKVIGVGGGGSNAVNHMYNQGIKDVEFIVCNTDMQALKSSPVPTKLQIGVNLTEGLGAGANPDKGRNAAIESKEDIRELLGDGTKMVFITAGMGGGTGTGAAPVLAKVAKDLDILTVGIVTVPFSFEGKKKMQQAEIGIRELKENCDTVLVILNDKLREIHGNLSIGAAFAKADNVLTTAAKGIAEIITVAGYVNVDFQDVRTVMHNAGAAVMGSATTEGESRARRAAEEALISPLLDNRDIVGAQKILLSIISGEQAELSMDELTEITEFIQEKTGDDAEMIFGHGVDPALGNSIRVTVIATGFERTETSDLPNAQARVVIDMERDSPKPGNLYSLFPEENGWSRQQEIVKKTREDDSPEERTSLEGKGYSFTSPVNEPSEIKGRQNAPIEDDLFGDDDEFEFIQAHDSADQRIDEEGMMDVVTSEERLRRQAEERVKKLKSVARHEPSNEDLKEKLDIPAYLRKRVNLNSVPHSSERNISKFNLNDDNQILGNNRFLHDNVD